MKLEFSRSIFEKYSNVEFHRDSSSGSRCTALRLHLAVNSMKRTEVVV